MYLRTTKRHNKDGSTVEYYQLAETRWDPIQRRPTAHIIHNFGRADTLDRDALLRLAQSISRVCQGGIDIPPEVSPPGEAIDIEWARPLGVVHVARALWEELGIGEVLRSLEPRGPRRAPHELALFTMVANRLAEPLSKRACYEHWRAERVYLPEAAALTLDHLYFALDFLDTHIEAIEREIFFRTADLFRADVDLIFWDTTSVYFEVDDEDTECETKRGTTLPPLRKRGYNKEGRGNQPQVVVGLALTRDGLPVRSWVFPGNTVDATTVAHVKESLPGRFRPVHASLEVKEVVVGEGERRRRYIVCRNMLEAARQRQHREEVLAALRQELARLDPQAPDHTKRACELVASKRYGRYLSRGPGGRLAINPQAVRRAGRMDGKYVLLTNDDTLSPEDVGLGYKAMMIIEACFRRMKTTGLRIRPVYHWTAHRITSHVKLCVLALLLERAAEIRVEDTWRNLRLALEEVKAVRYRAHGLTMVQSTRLTV